MGKFKNTASYMFTDDNVEVYNGIVGVDDDETFHEAYDRVIFDIKTNHPEKDTDKLIGLSIQIRDSRGLKPGWEHDED